MIGQNKLKVEQLKDVFDSEFYVNTYSDIAAAGVDPWEHFFCNGFYEKRLPCHPYALELEVRLWQEQSESVIERLITLHTQSNELENALSGWVLARWFGSFRQWGKVSCYLERFLACELAPWFISHQGPLLLYFSALFHQGRFDEARIFLEHFKSSESSDSPDLILAMSMLLDSENKLEALNHLWQDSGISLANYSSQGDGLSLFDRLPNFFPQHLNSDGSNDGPLVSIIIPCYNAEATIATALRSLVAQTWRNLEIIVVDDASTDLSSQVVSELASQFPQIQLIRHLQNQGAYAARNTALALTKGDYITVHDADDWSHPDKLSKQVECLRQNQSIVACVTHWVRSSNDLAFERWLAHEAWIYRNVSSLMFSRQVVDKIGFWDRVSVNADTEYYYRILKVFGDSSIEEVLPGTPLAFGRVLETALTSQGATHLRTQFKGLRKDYHDAALAWHQTSDSLYLSQYPKQRPFPIPDLMCRRLENTLIKPARHYIEGARCQDIGFVKQYYDALKRGDTESSEQFLAFIPTAIWS